jgi:hypothetical protein
LFNLSEGSCTINDGNYHTARPFLTLLLRTVVRKKEKTQAWRLKATHSRDAFPGKDGLTNLSNMAQLPTALTSDSGTLSSKMPIGVAIETERIINSRAETRVH